jgi:hypothetical protein
MAKAPFSVLLDPATIPFTCAYRSCIEDSSLETLPSISPTGGQDPRIHIRTPRGPGSQSDQEMAPSHGAP